MPLDWNKCCSNVVCFLWHDLMFVYSCSQINWYWCKRKFSECHCQAFLHERKAPNWKLAGEGSDPMSMVKTKWAFISKYWNTLHQPCDDFLYIRYEDRLERSVWTVVFIWKGRNRRDTNLSINPWKRIWFTNFPNAIYLEQKNNICSSGKYIVANYI